MNFQKNRRLVLNTLIGFCINRLHASSCESPKKILKEKSGSAFSKVLRQQANYSPIPEVSNPAAKIKSQKKAELESDCAFRLNCLEEIRLVKDQLREKAIQIIEREQPAKIRAYVCKPTASLLSERAKCLAKAVLQKLEANEEYDVTESNYHNILNQELNRYVVQTNAHEISRSDSEPSHSLSSLRDIADWDQKLDRPQSIKQTLGIDDNSSRSRKIAWSYIGEGEQDESEQSCSCNGCKIQ